MFETVDTSNSSEQMRLRCIKSGGGSCRFGLTVLVALVLVADSLFLADGQPTQRGSSSFVNELFPSPDRVLDVAVRSLESFVDSSLGELPNELLTNAIQAPTGASLDPDATRNVAQIIRSRNFECQELNVVTRDGYILTIQRIVNPLVPASERARLKPVLLQHGLMASSADWVLNSVGVRPAQIPHLSKETKPSPSQGTNSANIRRTARVQPLSRVIRARSRKLTPGAAQNLTTIVDANDSSINNNNNNNNNNHENNNSDTQEHPNSLGFYLANQGYDVFLGNTRGNTYGRRHVNMSSWDSRFWDFTFDEHIEYDLRDTISYILRLTNRTKLAYVGHSQGTAIMFGLMSEHPEYANIVEPFVALAPVAYVENVVTPARHFAPYAPYFQGVNMWFATSSLVERFLASIVCSNKVVRRDVCANIVFLGAGFDLDELDDSRIAAYLTHSPAGTSVKNLAHYGQEVTSGRFAHFDHGALINLVKYGTNKAPDYPLGRITSKSIVLFVADNDWLAAPKDVAHLIRSLNVKPYKVYNITEFKPMWNHLDFIYGKDAGELVNTRIIDVLKNF